MIVEDCRTERDRTVVIMVGGGRRVETAGCRGSRAAVCLSTIVGSNKGL